MDEPPLVTLERWEAHGAVWRTRWRSAHEAVIELCTCYGEPVDELRSGDPDLLRYLERRSSSDADAV